MYQRNDLQLSTLFSILARAVGVPVGRRLAGLLVTMLVATINDIIVKTPTQPQLNSTKHNHKLG